MLRVLIIEDLPINMLLAVAILQRAGHQALEAETATAGIAMAREHRPDVILMDIQLPDMDGLAATRLIKADAQLYTIPVIAVTAFAMKGDEDAVHAAGCDGYVTKPIRYKEFLAELESVLARRGVSRTNGPEPSRPAAP